jgi:hypothetical protein
MKGSRTLQLALLAGLLIAGLTCPHFAVSAADRVHRDVWLKNELGERITPQENRSDPYSPKRTCGTCHGYTTITKGYHFQQGFDGVSDRYDPKRPWVLSSGMYGRWLPYAAAGRAAAKANADPREIDLSAYDWIGTGKHNPSKKIQYPACGWCHPGGGPLEFGRTPEGRADLSRNLARGEAGNRNPLDGDYSSRYTPDGRSHFRESGVVEADCLICHLPSYRMEARNGQLNARNYRWAATAGAGLGRIQGAVFTFSDPGAGPGDPRFLSGSWNFSTRPLVTYAWSDRKRFTEEGLLRGSLVSRSVAPRNCLQCHGEGDAKNMGTINAAPHDAHAKAGLSCTDCHPLVGRTAEKRLEHQIAKGRFPQTTVRDDLDGVGMRTCIGCHKEGQYRPTRKGMPASAPDPERVHAEKFEKATFHTYLITCTGCHATAQPARGLALLDLSAGEEKGFTADGYRTTAWPQDYTTLAPEPWKSWMTRGRPGEGYGEAYLAHVPKRIQWFGEKIGGGVRPIPLHHVKEAFQRLKGVSSVEAVRTDGAKVKTPAILTDEEIVRMISSLTKAGFRDVVFLSDRLYEIVAGRLTAGKETFAADSYPVAHGIVPLGKKTTYGVRGRPDGCKDCHDRAAPFFTKVQVENIREFLRRYPELQGPQALPQMNGWGLTRVPPSQ